VGQEMSVVGTDVGVLAATEGPDAPSGMRTFPYEIGATSADVILGIAQGKRRGGEIIRVASSWLEGATLGPAPNAPATTTKGGTPMHAQTADV